jgi:hypothetical protein
MLPDELSQKSDLVPVDGLPAVSPRSASGITAACQKENQNASFLFRLFQLTFGHTGAASISGLPAANSSCA